MQSHRFKNKLQQTISECRLFLRCNLQPVTCKLAAGFTIIETLVAITVLMIAIAGPLVVASKGLTGALASKDQMIAAYLAQESMETIKNIRDNNEATDQSSYLDNPTGPPALLSSCDPKTPLVCDASAVDPDTVIECPPTGCPIYTELNNGRPYGHDGGGGQSTLFTRYFYLSTGSDTNEQTVSVVVDWHEGPVPYEISLSSELDNSTR